MARPHLRKNWRDYRDLILFVIGFFGVVYSDQIRQDLSPLFSIGNVNLTGLVLAIFGGIFVIGSVAWAWRQLSKLRRKPTIAPLATTTEKRPFLPFEGMEFYSNRGELPELKPIMESAINSVSFLGIALSDLVAQKHEIIRQTARRGISMTFLLLNPESKLVPEVEKAWLASNLKDRINASLKDLCKIKSELPDFQKGYINVRTYDLLPIHTLLMVDSRFIRVDSYLYGNQPNSWTSIKYPDNAAELFKKYEKSWLHALSKSTEYKCEHVPIDISEANALLMKAALKTDDRTA